MKSFRQYLAESTREHGFVIKLAVEPSDEQLDAVERYLMQFGLLEMTAPIVLKGDKREFIDQPNHHVYQINFITNMPLSSYIVMQGIREVMNVPEKNIVVRTAVEPVEIYADGVMTDRAFSQAAADDDLVPAARLSTDRFYQDIEQPVITDIYGDAYNKRFLDYLASTKSTRPSDQYHTAAPLFSWLDMDKVAAREPLQDLQDFNANYHTPKPVTRKNQDMAAEPTPRSGLGPEGNFDDGASVVYRFYKDRNGNRVNMDAPLAPNKAQFVRKG
jgi:hypothetical protein